MTKQALNPSILLIEHDNERQHLIQRTLYGKGFQVKVASGWQHGITLAQETQPDLILFDMDMPGIGGSALALRLSSQPELGKTAIIALIGQGLEKRALIAGCTGTLVKPINPDQLATQVGYLVHGQVHNADPQEWLQGDERIEQLENLAADLAEQLEEQTATLDEHNRQLQDANQITHSFLSTASRELRTPLTLINGYVTLMQSMVAQLDPAAAPLSLIEMPEGLVQGTSRLNSIVEDLLRVSRIVTGDISLAIGPTRVGRLVSIAINELEAKDKTPIKIKDLDKLPIIQADGNQIRLAIRNIVNHLLNTVPDDGQVVIAGQHDDDIVILTIIGVGVTIDPAEQEALFDRLYPVSRDSNRSGRPSNGNLGFGLAVAKGIIQAHGGRIWVENTGQSESTFSLLLPTHLPE